MVNTVVLEGRLVRDPVLSRANTGRSACTFVIVHQRAGNSSSRDYIKCEAWDRTAENICTYLRKGSHLCVTGQVYSKKYENWKREDVFETYVNVTTVSFMPTPVNAKNADQFFEKYPEILKLYNKFVKEELKKGETNNESDCISEN